MQVLLTGFGPFLDVHVNPSGLIAARLDGERLPIPGGPAIAARVLPVAFVAAAEAVRAAVAELAPRVTLLVGVARGPDYRLERRATARITSEHPDATGQVLAGTPLGSADLQTTRDVGRLVAALKDRGHSTVMSDDCGGYVCNSTYHAALTHIPTSLFLHIPPGSDAESVERGAAIVRELLALMVGEQA